jgi:energy-coupling factor transporter ATP-binding protein EcfA2
MLTHMQVRNFRSIEGAEMDFGPITVLFGPTSSGKSSLLYSLLVLRSFTLNPNQSADGLFNLGFLDMGGFDACVFNHIDPGVIEVNASFDTERGAGSYGIRLRKNEAEIATRVDGLKMTTQVPVPYGAGTSWAHEYIKDDEAFTVNWNGFASSVVPKSGDPEHLVSSIELSERVNSPAEALKRVDVCPHRRGFYKPSYAPVPLTPTPTGENEVATLIIGDQNSPPRISIDTVEIFDRDFRTYTVPGTATTYLQTTEQTGARIPGLLVNDGFGVNQVVYMLAKIHSPATDTVLIEEPEVHLHPTVIRKFARVCARLATEDRKQLVFTTHSAQFLLSLLACVAEGLLSPSNIRCYYALREKKATQFNPETVSEEGQISGGMASFMEAELYDMKAFLKVDRK